MEILFALVGINLSTTVFTLFEVIRLENILDRMINSLVSVSEEDEESGAKTFM